MSCGTHAPAVVEPLLRQQPRGSKGLLRVIRTGGFGPQSLRELLHLQEVALDAREALRILCRYRRVAASQAERGCVRTIGEQRSAVSWATSKPEALTRTARSSLCCRRRSQSAPACLVIWIEQVSNNLCCAQLPCRPFGNAKYGLHSEASFARPRQFKPTGTPGFHVLPQSFFESRHASITPPLTPPREEPYPTTSPARLAGRMI